MKDFQTPFRPNAGPLFSFEPDGVFCLRLSAGGAGIKLQKNQL